MSDRARSAVALVTLFCGAAVACGGSEGSKHGGVDGATPFSSQFFPLELSGTAGGFGNAAFATGGELLVVGGLSDTIFGVSRSDGSIREVATNVAGGDGLLSIVDGGAGVLYAGSDMGDIYAIDGAGASTLLVATGAGAVNGLAIAPKGYGDFGGDLVAATENGGLLAIDPAAPNPPETIGGAGTLYSDLAFRGTTLYALDYAAGEIDKVSAGGTVTTFASGLGRPDGIELDEVNDQLLVADAASDTLLAVSLPGAALSELGAFHFTTGFYPSGLAFDGVGNLIVVTDDDGALALHGVGIPGYDPADFPVALANSDGGYSGLALDRNGDLVGAANDGLNGTNRVYRVTRAAAAVSDLATNVGDPAGGELLLGVAVDPATETVYLGTSFGNIFLLNAAGASMLAQVPGEKIDGLAFAPAAFDPALVGDLVAVTSGGSVLSIDIASPTPSLIVDVDSPLSDLVFAADGTLYVADYGNGEILELTPGSPGTPSTFATGLTGPDGLALDEGGGRLLVADSGLGMLLQVSIPGAAVSGFAGGSFDFDPGYYPSGLVFDGLASALLTTGQTAATLEAFAVFP